MNPKQFKIIRLVITGLVAVTVATAVSANNFFLAIGGVVIGMLFVWLVRARSKKPITDERISMISGGAARMAYAVNVMVLLFLAIFFIITGDQKADLYVESLGTAFAFIVLLQVALYSISFYYYNHQYGGNEK